MRRNRSLALLIAAAVALATNACNQSTTPPDDVTAAPDPQDPCSQAYLAYQKQSQPPPPVSEYRTTARLAQAARSCYEQHQLRPKRALALLDAEIGALGNAQEHWLAYQRFEHYFEHYAASQPVRSHVVRRIQQGHHAFRAGRDKPMLEAYRRALADTETIPPGLRQDMQLAIAAGLHAARAFHEAAAVLRPLTEASPEDDADPFITARALQLLAQGAVGRCDEPTGRGCSFRPALAYADEAARLFDASGRHERALSARITRAEVLSWMGSPVSALELLDEVLEQAALRDLTEVAEAAAAARLRIEQAFDMKPSPVVSLLGDPVRVGLLLALLVGGVLTVLVVRTRRGRRLVSVPVASDPPSTVTVPAYTLRDPGARKPLRAFLHEKTLFVTKIYWWRANVHPSDDTATSPPSEEPAASHPPE